MHTFVQICTNQSNWTNLSAYCWRALWDFQKYLYIGVFYLMPICTNLYKIYDQFHQCMALYLLAWGDDSENIYMLGYCGWYQFSQIFRPISPILWFKIDGLDAMNTKIDILESNPYFFSFTIWNGQNWGAGVYILPE